jgi:hypothetical protein
VEEADDAVVGLVEPVTPALPVVLRGHGATLVTALAVALAPFAPFGGEPMQMHDLLRAYAAGLAATHDSQQARHAALTGLFDYYLAACTAAMDCLAPAERHHRPDPPLQGTPSRLSGTWPPPWPGWMRDIEVETGAIRSGGVCCVVRSRGEIVDPGWSDR